MYLKPRRPERSSNDHRMGPQICTEYANWGPRRFKGYAKLAASSSRSLAVETWPCLSISRGITRFLSSRLTALHQYRSGRRTN